MNLDLPLEKNILSGLLLIDKQEGITSYQVVSHLKKKLRLQKVGHVGTLDPFATGLLPVLLNGATRLFDEMMNTKKQYLFTIQLGQETDTLDSSGTLVAQATVPSDVEDKMKNALDRFLGITEQIPPVYSALKMQGRPLYEHMRVTGQLPAEIETKKRKIFIEKIEFLEYNPVTATVTLRVLCGKGTYIRALARDLAKAIGTVGYCSALRREALIELFTSESQNDRKGFSWQAAHGILFDFKRSLHQDELIQNIIPPEKILPQFPKILLGSESARELLSGNSFFVPQTDLLHFFSQEKLEKRPSNVNKAFVGLKNHTILFLSTLEYEKNLDAFKVQPRKKISS